MRTALRAGCWLLLFGGVAQAQPPRLQLEGPAVRSNCESYKKGWDQYFKQLGDQHSACLDAHRGGESNPLGDCSYAACQPFHSPARKFPEVGPAYEQCMTAARETERQEAAREAEYRRQQREQEQALRESQRLAEKNHRESQREAETLAGLYEQNQRKIRQAELGAQQKTDAAGNAVGSWSSEVSAQFGSLVALKQQADALRQGYGNLRDFASDPVGSIVQQGLQQLAPAEPTLRPDIAAIIDPAKQANEAFNDHELSEALTGDALDRLGGQASGALDAFDQSMGDADRVLSPSAGYGQQAATAYSTLDRALGMAAGAGEARAEDSSQAPEADTEPNAGWAADDPAGGGKPLPESTASADEAGDGHPSSMEMAAAPDTAAVRLDSWFQQSSAPPRSPSRPGSPARQPVASGASPSADTRPSEHHGRCDEALQAQEREFEALNLRPLPDGATPALRRVMWMTQTRMALIDRLCPQQGHYAELRQAMASTYQQASATCAQLSSSGPCAPDAY